MISSAVFSCLIAEVTFKIYLGSNSRAMADKEKKRGRWKHKKIIISRMKRAF